MAANAKLMETLHRIEHKMDMILRRGVVQNEYPKMGDPQHICPVCKDRVEYQVDIGDSVVVRKCKCSTGKIALDLGAFAPPVAPAKGRDNERGTEENDSGSDGRKPRNR